MDTKSLRARARAHLAGNWALSIGIAVVAAILGGMITGTSFLPDTNFIDTPALQSFIDKLNQGIKIGAVTFSFRDGIFGFAAFLLGGTLQLGYAQFLLKQHDGQDARFQDLFSQFDRFGTGFAQRFLRGLYELLWGLLFLIPGIIKSYSYAMMPFILAENPHLSASEAISRSQELMDGHKSDLFILDLSFIGWILLCMLTLNLGNLALNPYRNAAYAAFYRQLLAEQAHTFIE